MKILSGAEIVDFVKERQAKQVRNLKQSHHTQPRLAIVRCDEGNEVISMYVRLKKAYGADIGVEVETYEESPTTVAARIDELAAREDVHGVIVQLPVVPAEMTQDLVNRVAPHQDVDGLGDNAGFDPATPVAILWLLAGYNIDPRDVALVGRGRLVGAPLEKMLRASGATVSVFDLDSEVSLAEFLADKQLVVTATGQPGLISSDMLAHGTAVVDASTASEDGVIRGDLASDVYERDDLKVTPTRGGVGPLTVAALFENVLRSARDAAARQTPQL